VEVPFPLSTVTTESIASVTITFDELVYLTYKVDGGGGIGDPGSFS
jgi:hypothetical protein